MFFRLLITLMLFTLVACSSGLQSGVYHTVRKGQTLYTISRVYDIDEHYLARINNVSDPTELQVGKRIYIPGAAVAKPVPVTVREPAPKPPRNVATVNNPAPAKSVSKPKPEVRRNTTPTKKAPVSKEQFIWPVKGEIVRKFGSGTSKGLEIAVNSGTPVSSAAAGKVIYSGSGITGYGNLVIVRHDKSFFTVYGYNKTNIVEAGAFVSKGEKIAYSGKPPSGGKNRVYFEIRYGKKPVNPLSYLP